MSKLKQVIVMRTDTDPPMRKGKMIAQGGHAVLAFLTQRMKPKRRWGQTLFEWLGASFNPLYEIELFEEEQQWMDTSYAKVCVQVKSEAELLDIQTKALLANLEVHLVTDSGLTEFGQPTNTCLAIGPDWSEKIDPITGHLKLL